MMFEQMDYVDAPYMTMKQRHNRPADSFQNELKQKMRQRKSLGLTADVTSEESEGIDDGHDSEEENSFTMKYRMTPKRADRPTSAKRRGNPDLGETLRADDANKWLKSNKYGKDSMSTLRETPPLKESPRFSKQPPTKSEIDQMFGTPRSQTSPLDKKLRQSPVESPGRTSPGSTLPKSLFGGKTSGKTSPATTTELTAEEKIFGRKTPTNESPKEKEWRAPSFKKPPFGEAERTSPSADVERRGGRKTPVDSSLLPIDESPRPQPRSRFARTTSPKDSKFKTRDSSPRELSLESPRAERPKPKVDLFGRKEKHVEIDDDDEERMPSRERRRFQRDDKRSIGQKQASGRHTPTGRKTPTGRETPTGRKTPTGRQTPTNRHTRFEEEEEKKKSESKERGLFDFLTDDAPKPSRKSGGPSGDRRRGLSEERDEDYSGRRSYLGSDRRKSSLKKSTSQDSITQEFQDQPSMLEASTKDDTGKKIPTDQSSVCYEIEEDPNKQFEREKQREETKKLSKNQRSDRKEADDIISRVEDAQTDPKPIRDRPASAKTQDKVVKPKPRHSLPGSRPSSAGTSEDMFNSTMSIRQTIYEEWRKGKTKEIKEKTQQQKKKEEEEKKKKEKDEKDKKLESLASYQAWMKQKEETFVKDKQKQKKEEEKKKKEEEREKLVQKKEAKRNFEKWKEAKDEKLIEQHKKKVEEVHRKKQEEREKKREKEKDNESAYKRWKSKKDVVIEENQKKQKEEEMMTRKTLKQTQRQKEQESFKEYNEWLKKKVL
ncbi:hypothetical protein ACF0H5_008833 [Mactra antiquata]